ncbi:MAG: hypothetical protein ABMB14_10220 [Myxococcota bacterium]
MIALVWGSVAVAGDVGVGGYFRVMARPDLQGGIGRLGYWNLYGRLMNEGPYGMLDLRYDVLAPEPGSNTPWTSVHARIEGGSIANLDPGNGTLTAFRLSQMYVQGGNVLLDHLTWQLGTLEYYFGDLGLYDMRPATLFAGTGGVSATYRTDAADLLVGFGDSGFSLRGLRYDAVPTVGGAARVRAGRHLELGVGGELRVESSVLGNVNAPYQTPDLTYEDWIRGEVLDQYVQDYGEDLLDYFPAPEPRSATSYAVIGQLGFGNAGPLRWNNLFVRWERRHPDPSTTETGYGQTVELWVHDFTDQRYSFVIGDEAELRLIPDRLDLAIAGIWGDDRDLDNQIVPSAFDRTWGSTVARLQLYPASTFHFLAETSLAREWSRNGNTYREHRDSIFANTDGRPDTRGLEVGDADVRHTWQGKAGIVLNPLGPGIYVRPSLRFLYGVQYSSQNNAFGNSFVETVDQYSDFDTVEQHLHHLVAIEAEVWF